MPATKIATCCYCGTKAALVLRGKDRHELACGTCGAPLHAMKQLPNAPSQQKSKDKPKAASHAKRKPRKRQKRKGFGQRLMSEIWDAVEDVVEDIFD